MVSLRTVNYLEVVHMIMIKDIYSLHTYYIDLITQLLDSVARVKEKCQRRRRRFEEQLFWRDITVWFILYLFGMIVLPEIHNFFYNIF